MKSKKNVSRIILLFIMSAFFSLSAYSQSRLNQKPRDTTVRTARVTSKKLPGSHRDTTYVTRTAVNPFDITIKNAEVKKKKLKGKQDLQKQPLPKKE